MKIVWSKALLFICLKTSIGTKIGLARRVVVFSIDFSGIYYFYFRKTNVFELGYLFMRHYLVDIYKAVQNYQPLIKRGQAIVVTDFVQTKRRKHKKYSPELWYLARILFCTSWKIVNTFHLRPKDSKPVGSLVLHRFVHWNFIYIHKPFIVYLSSYNFTKQCFFTSDERFEASFSHVKNRYAFLTMSNCGFEVKSHSYGIVFKARKNMRLSP